MTEGLESLKSARKAGRLEIPVGVSVGVLNLNAVWNRTPPSFGDLNLLSDDLCLDDIRPGCRGYSALLKATDFNVTHI